MTAKRPPPPAAVILVAWRGDAGQLAARLGLTEAALDGLLKRHGRKAGSGWALDATPANLCSVFSAAKRRLGASNEEGL